MQAESQFDSQNLHPTIITQNEPNETPPYLTPNNRVGVNPFQPAVAAHPLQPPANLPPNNQVAVAP